MTGIRQSSAVVLDDRGQPTTATIAAVTATLGILSGYALYILWWQQGERGEGAETFLMAFAAAAVMSFIFEVLRGAVEGSTHPWSRARVVSTIVMLAAFELFIIAAHTTVELKSDGSSAAARLIFGQEFADKQGSTFSLLALGAFWVFVALFIVFKLRRFIGGWPYPDSHPQPAGTIREYLSGIGPDLARGAWAGITAGVFWGSVGAILYVFLLRLFLLAQWIRADYPAWQQSLASGGPLHLSGNFFMLVYGPAMLAGWFAKYLGGLGLFLGVVVVSAIARSVVSDENRDAATLWPPLTIVILLAAPILTSPGARRDLVNLVYLSAVIWGIPAMVLGLLTPLLRRPAHHPPLWGVVASAAACVMLVVTAARLYYGTASVTEQALLVIANAALLTLAFALFRGAWSEEFWLCVALSIGTIVWGTTSLMQKVNLFAMQERAQALIALPLAETAASAPAGDIFSGFSVLLKNSRSSAADGLTNNLALLPAGIDVAEYLVNPCSVLRNLTPAQHAAFGSMLTQTAAADRDSSREQTLAAQTAEGDLEQFERSRQYVLDTLKHMPTERVSAVTEALDKKLAALETAVEASSKSVAGTALFIGHSQLPDRCQSDLDSLLADVNAAAQERRVAASSLVETRKKVATQIASDSENIAEARSSLDQTRAHLRLVQAQHLELTMTSSLGFWVTIGVLAIWRLEQPDLVEPA